MNRARHTGFAKLTQKDVSQAVARHEMLYSGRMGGARAAFAFCDLSGLDLSGRNLADADFTGAVLEETNFAGARWIRPASSAPICAAPISPMPACGAPICAAPRCAAPT